MQEDDKCKEKWVVHTPPRQGSFLEASSSSKFSDKSKRHQTLTIIIDRSNSASPLSLVRTRSHSRPWRSPSRQSRRGSDRICRLHIRCRPCGMCFDSMFYSLGGEMVFVFFDRDALEKWCLLAPSEWFELLGCQRARSDVGRFIFRFLDWKCLNVFCGL